MKILVLGASGFVGNNILKHLLHSGIEVIALCRDPAVNAIYPLLSGLSWMSIDDALNRPCSYVDSLLSFAGIGLPSAFELQPTAMAAAEIGIAELICNLTVRYDLRSVQYLSSAGAVYGEGWVDEPTGGYGRVFNENNPCNPISVYGQSKLAAERHLAACLADLAPSAKLTVLRATNIYGPHYVKAGKQGLINALLDCWSRKIPIKQYGDGLIYRDYLYVSDLAAANLACLHRPVTGIINIGVGCSLSILDIIYAIEVATGSCFERHLLPARAFDVRYSAVTIEKARALLGWTPLVSLEEGISRILNHRYSK